MRFLLFLLFSISLSFAEEAPPAPPPLQQEEAGISLVDAINTAVPRVHDTVSIMSGAWIESGVALTDSNQIDPFCLGYGYSKSYEEGSLANGWEFFHPSEVRVIEEEDRVNIISREAGGARILYRGNKKGKNCKPLLANTGYTYLSSIQSPLRTDPKTTSIRWSKKKKSVQMHFRDGTERLYEKYRKHRFHIVKMSLPSGNWRFFHYNKKSLRAIETKTATGVVIGKVSFEKRGKNELVATASDGKSVSFFYKTIDHSKQAGGKVRAVTAIHPQGGKKLDFTYSASSKRMRKVEKKKSSDGKIVQAEFFKKKTSSSQWSFRKGRVQTLFSTLLPGETDPQRSHSFSYTKGSDGRTFSSAIEHDGVKTLYEWNRESQRIRWIRVDDSLGNPLSYERFVWQKGGRLLRRVLFDESRQPLLMKEWTYDKQGNVLREDLYGYFFHIASLKKPLVLDKKAYSWVSGGDRLTWKASYDKWGRTKDEIDPSGYVTEYSYLRDDGTSLLTKKLRKNSKGEILERAFYKYNADGVPIEETGDDGSAASIDDLTHVTLRKTSRITPRTEMPMWGAPTIREEFVWTASGGEKRAKKSVLERDPKSGLVTKEDVFGSTDAHPIITTFSYDSLGRLIETHLPDGSWEQRGYEQETGRLSSIVNASGREELSYDHEDRVISRHTLFPDGSSTTTHSQYDVSGRCETHIDERGRKRVIHYDPRGRVVLEEHPSLSWYGQTVVPKTMRLYKRMKSMTTFPDWGEERTSCTSFGKPMKISFRSGGKSFVRYDPLGRKVEETAPSGLTTKTEYDDWGHVVRVIEEGDGISQVTLQRSYARDQLLSEESLGTKTTFSYDDFGRISSKETRDKVTDAAYTTRYSYDAFHRVVETIHPESGTKESVSYDNMGRVIETRSSSLSDETTLSHQKKSYDFLGRVVEESVLSTDWNKTQYAYGAYNLLSKTTFADGSEERVEVDLQRKGKNGLFYLVEKRYFSDGTSEETWKDGYDLPVLSCSYDILQRLVSKRVIEPTIMGTMAKVIDIPIDPRTGDPFGDASTTEFVYDTRGNCVRETRGEGFEVVMRYDSMSRKVEEKKPSGITLFSQYDKRGRLLLQKSSDDSIQYRFSYDDLGYLKEAEDLVHDETVQRRYSGSGLLLQETFSDGNSISYDHDAIGRVEKITSPIFGTISQGYDKGYLSFISYKEHQFTYHDRSPLGVPQKLMMGFLQVDKRHDVMGRMTQVSSPLFSEERLQFNVQGACDRARFHLPHETTPREEVYSYDALGQLTSDSHRDYTFDSLSRAIELDGEKRQFNTLHQQIGRSYDIDGRLGSGDEDAHYFYDALDRLIRVEKGEATCAYNYDAFHRRVSRTTNGTVERFLFIDDNEVGSYLPDGTISSFRVLGEGLGAEIGATLLVMNSDGDLFYALSDLAGNIRALVDPVQETVAEWYDYTAFGPKARSQTATSPWTFASKREEPITGFIFFGRRFYDPKTLTWITLDPLGFSQGPNLYAYVQNSPLMFFDAYGLSEDAPYRRSWWPCFEFSALSSLSGSSTTSSHSFSSSFTNAPFLADFAGTPSRSSASDLFSRGARDLLSFPGDRRSGLLDSLFSMRESSGRYDLSRFGCREIPGGLGTGFINGIRNDSCSSRDSASHLSTLSGGYNVHGVFSATRGWVGDMGGIALGFLNVSTSGVRYLHQMWDHFFNTHSETAKFLMFGHSGGVLEMRNALRTYDLGRRKRILVVGIAPAAYIDPEICADVIHYRAKRSRDLIPRGDLLGAMRARGTIVTLPSHPDAPRHDHSFTSPTYQDVIERRILNYINSGGKHL